CAGREPFNVAETELETRRQLGCARRLEHPLRSVDANGLARLEPRVQFARLLTRAAAEIGDAHPRPGLNHGQKIVEGLFTLSFELAVLGGVPRIRHVTLRSVNTIDTKDTKKASRRKGFSTICAFVSFVSFVFHRFRVERQPVPLGFAAEVVDADAEQ